MLYKEYEMCCYRAGLEFLDWLSFYLAYFFLRDQLLLELLRVHTVQFVGFMAEKLFHLSRV